MRARKYGFGLLCVLAALLAQGSLTVARADSFNYQMNATVSLFIAGNGRASELGTLTGGFTIDTNGVPFNHCSPFPCPNGNSTYTDPSVASGLLIWNPVEGPSVPLTVEPVVYTIAGGGAGLTGTSCTFAAGSYCPFLLNLGEVDPGQTDGFIYVFGTLGEQLTVFGSDGQSGLTIYSQDGTTTVANIFSGAATPTPEPPTIILWSLGTILFWLGWRLSRRNSRSDRKRRVLGFLLSGLVQLATSRGRYAYSSICF